MPQEWESRWTQPWSLLRVGDCTLVKEAGAEAMASAERDRHPEGERVEAEANPALCSESWEWFCRAWATFKASWMQEGNLGGCQGLELHLDSGGWGRARYITLGLEMEDTNLDGRSPINWREIMGRRYPLGSITQGKQVRCRID